MGRHQQAESSGIISFVICAIIAWFVMNAYMQFAPAIWRVTQRLFTVCSGNRGRMRRYIIQSGLCTKITIADAQTWLDYSGPSYFRDSRAFRGVCRRPFSSCRS